ncbi:MAG: 30S ribosomal protein S8 [bacterium]|nr:30S ribosomal protein S8 [bacterium]
MNGRLCDLITRFRNAYQRYKTYVEVINTKMLQGFCDCLKRVGLIKNLILTGGKRYLRVYLAYDSVGIPLLRTLKHISKGSLRKHVTVKTLRSMGYSGGYFILSTSKG